MRRKKTLARPPKAHKPDDLITQSEAIALLADRDRRQFDSDRVRKARMRARIKYAVDNGVLIETLSKSKKCYVYGRIVAWAQGSWPGKYDDLEAIRAPSVGSVNGVLRRLTGNSSAYQIPETLSECQAQLAQAMERIFSLLSDLEVARRAADRLRPDAEAWQHQCEANRQNAKQPRPRG